MKTKATIDWNNATQGEKIGVFAKHVAHLKHVYINGYGTEHTFYIDKDEQEEVAPDYLHDLNAVMPWVQKQDQWHLMQGKNMNGKKAVLIMCVVWTGKRGDGYMAEAPTVCEAAMKVLLRANGVEVID